MSLNYENVGKNIIYNRSVDNIEDYVKGTIVGCYIGEDEEYYVTSIESSGECIKVYDDSLLEVISDGGGGSEPLIVTFSGTTSGGNAACDKTYGEIQAAGRNVDLWYERGSTLWKLTPRISARYLEAYAQKIFDPTNPGRGYFTITCVIDNDNVVDIEVVEV